MKQGIGSAERRIDALSLILYAGALTLVSQKRKRRTWSVESPKLARRGVAQGFPHVNALPNDSATRVTIGVGRTPCENNCSDAPVVKERPEEQLSSGSTIENDLCCQATQTR